MQIVIDIPKDVIESAKSSPNFYPTYHFEKIWRAIANGMPLPKGHGRLIDADALNEAYTYECISECDRCEHCSKDGHGCELLLNAPTIIEADKESEDAEQIKVGTKVRTIKDKDFAGEEVFPVGTIGIVEEIREDEKLPYIIRANHDYWYYSKDMFEVIEDIEPQERSGEE